MRGLLVFDPEREGELLEALRERCRVANRNSEPAKPLPLVELLTDQEIRAARRRETAAEAARRNRARRRQAEGGRKSRRGPAWPAQAAQARRIVRMLVSMTGCWPTVLEVRSEMLSVSGNVAELGRSAFFAADRSTQARYCRDALLAVRAEVERSSGASKHSS
jgi:hypothetical protein